jgi:SP family sugar:H+ symporter-like MFS transporter
MALATASNWLWNFLLGFFTPFITSAIDFAYGYVFAGCLFVAVLVVYFFVLEGKGKTLEEVDMMYVMRVPPWESSKWVPPPPEERVTTANVLDQRAARNIADEEEQGKRGQYGPGHQHIDQDGAGPSASGTV